jgi:hypothetical protein
MEALDKEWAEAQEPVDLEVEDLTPELGRGEDNSPRIEVLVWEACRWEDNPPV